uniref:BOS complex subunit TMEM147 n=1 Tax=Panagrellus redivivus TaxID=6233 RepID=A0A7E5A0S4_PANRE
MVTSFQMTFFHALNCVTLAYVPLVILYKYSGITEYVTIWKVLRATGIYFVTQFVKMLVLATLFPDIEGDESNLILEFFKSLADTLDIIGVHLAITYAFSGKGEIRSFAAGYSWGVGHAIGRYLASFINVARTTAYHSQYIQYAIESNFDVFYFLAFAHLVWLSSRSGLSTKTRPVVMVALMLFALKAFFFHLLQHYFDFQSWTLLASKLALTAAYISVALHAYKSYRSHSTPEHAKRN